MKVTSKRLLSALLLTGLLAGCGSTPQGGTSSGGAAPSDNFNKEGLPIVNEPVTLDVLTTRWGSMGDTFTKNQWLVDLETATNVKVEWQVQSTNDWAEQKSILLASGTLPSVCFGAQTFTSSDIVNNIDYFLPFEDYLDYMPNLKAILDTDSVVVKMSTFPDGKMYSIAARYPSRPWTTQQPVINMQWLQNLGLEVPDTIDELHDVLLAFKEQDANGNGDPNDEIPFTSKGYGSDLLTLFDINSQTIETNMDIDENGEPYFIPTSEKYKDAMKWSQQLFAEGIIDAETFTQDDTMTNAKFQNADISLVGFTFQWTPDAVFNTWKDEYDAITPPAGYYGNRNSKGQVGGYSYAANQVEITKFCENPEIAARWIDQFYTNEASIQNFWGAIGTVIEENNGTYSLMDPPEGTSADAWYWEQSLRDFGPHYIYPEFDEKIKLSAESGDGLKLILDEKGKDYVHEHFPAEINYTAEEYEELPTLTTDIDSFVTSTRARWVSDASIDIDAEWDAYVKQLNDMGLEQLVSIRKAGYERYQKAGE